MASPESQVTGNSNSPGQQRHGGAGTDSVAPLKEKIRSIESRLSEIRQRKKDMEVEADKSRMRSPPKDYTKPIKAYFHHPHLEYVFGEIVHSP
jgi:cAMP phosphodiesterase